MKNVWIIVTAAIALLASAMCEHYAQEAKFLRQRLDETSAELVLAKIPLLRDTIRDSIEVVTQTVVEVAPKAMRDALAADERLIKELRLKVQQLKALQTTTLETRDTVRAAYSGADCLFRYSDQWADVRLSLRDSTFYYNIRDSLATVVYREYRHRFLWWRWGTKGYRLKIVNFNPHARVLYNSYVKAEE